MSNSASVERLSDQSVSTENSSDIENSNILAEYQTLRDDILKRIDFRYRLINLLLVVAGTFFTLGLGLEPGISASVLLIYPILALFLAAGWAHNGVVMVRIGQYIKDHIEVKTAGLEWQSFITQSSPQFAGFSFLGSVSTWGLILTTQILALILAGLKFNSTLTEWVLLICGLAAFAFTLRLLHYYRQIRR